MMKSPGNHLSATARFGLPLVVIFLMAVTFSAAAEPTGKTLQVHAVSGPNGNGFEVVVVDRSKIDRAGSPRQ